ncbi:uncharacterized protein ACN427_000538 isoform 1-T1 [Glossina fuscipes fuscipes]
MRTSYYDINVNVLPLPLLLLLLLRCCIISCCNNGNIASVRAGVGNTNTTIPILGAATPNVLNAFTANNLNSLSCLRYIANNTVGNRNSQLTSIIENLSHNNQHGCNSSSGVGGGNSNCNGSNSSCSLASVSTSSSAVSAATAASVAALISSSSLSTLTKTSGATTLTLLPSYKPYPSINSAYWLPSPNPSPYSVPGLFHLFILGYLKGKKKKKNKLQRTGKKTVHLLNSASYSFEVLLPFLFIAH